jgi:hypothetical protein
MKAHLRFCAMLDAIVSPELRSFEFHATWAKDEQMGAFKDTEGDCFFAWFSAEGAVVRGFVHESPMSPYRRNPPEPWASLWDGLPASLSCAKTEPAFGGDDVTFAFWADGLDGPWTAGPVKPPKDKDPDGAATLLFGPFSKEFCRWAEGYYDQKLAAAAIEALRAQDKTLVSASVAALNPTFDLQAVENEAKALDWPVDLDGASVAAPAPASPPQPPRARSFGGAEFIVRCEPARVVMLIHGKKVVAEAGVNIYEELFDLVKARLQAAKKR